MWPFRQRPARLAPYSALIDSSSRILLALNTNPAVIAFLAEATMDTSQVSGVNYYHPGEPFPLAQEKPERYPTWTWSVGEKRFARNASSPLTDEVRARSRLAMEKGRAVGNVIRGISTARYPVSTGILLQESVYLTKKAQAEAFKDAGCPEDDIMEYPYVVQYADLANLPLKDAADDILFKAKLDDELLAKTELLRMKYLNLIKDAKTPEELGPIYESFLREGFKNALV